jgi:hypothetical protein
LNSGFGACQAGALTLEPCPILVLKKVGVSESLENKKGQGKTDIIV